jgi:protein-disulfide isomerase
MEGKKIAIIAGSVGLVAAIGYLLVLLASGTSYEITVKDPVVGPADAPVVIEEFADFQCPACKVASVPVKEILKAYPTQVRLVYKDFPIPGHQHARLAAAAALCSAQQDKFLPFYDKMFARQDEWAVLDRPAFDAFVVALAKSEDLNLDVDAFNTCRNSRDAKREVENDYQEGIDRTVNSTPTFFINGEKRPEVLSVFQWIQAINAELEKKGITPENTTSNPQA